MIWLPETKYTIPFILWDQKRFSIEGQIHKRFSVRRNRGNSNAFLCTYRNGIKMDDASLGQFCRNFNLWSKKR